MNTSAIEIIPRAIMVGIASSITVGPVAIMTIQRTLSRGSRAGIFSALGISSADTLLAMISYLFYSLVRGQISEHSYILRIVGGVIVASIGLSIIVRNPIAQIRKNSGANCSPWRDFISIAGLTCANFIAVIPYILAFFALFHIKPIEHIEKHDDVINSVMVVWGFLVGSLMWWFSLVFGVNKVRSRFKFRHLAIINRVAGSLIILLGVITIISTIFNIQPDGF